MTIQNPMQLDGRRILVTGASSGIGRAIAQLCDRLGANVVLVGRNEERLRQTLETLSKRDHHVEVMDLMQTSTIPAWLQALAGKLGSLSGLVHSAGVYQLKPLQFMSEKNWNDVLTPNLNAAVQLAKGFRQKGVHESKSSIVFVSSVMGLVGQPGTAAYAATKGALIAMSKSLALELANEGIRVNCVAPGQVRTEMMERQRTMLTDEQYAAIERMHPLGIGEATDVANAVAFLLADTARWITGTTLVVDGGYTAH